MFAVWVTDPAAFSATTVGTTGTLENSQLFLFDAAGFGVYANDNDPGGGTLSSTLPAGHAFGPPTPGLYFLAISGSSNWDPVSAAGIIFPTSPRSGVFGPSGPGGGAPISGWSGFGSFGSYTITLTGAAAAGAAAPIPEPSTIVLMSAFIPIGGLYGWYHRKRSAQQRPHAHQSRCTA
jgi:hypothetical protein